MSEVFILPIFVAMLVCLLMNVEHGHQMWKHLFVLPVKKAYLFWGKLLVVTGILFAFFDIFFLFVLGDAWFLIHHLQKANPLNLAPEWQKIGKLLLDSFIAILPILIIHFWLSFRIKNRIVNVGIGFAGVMMGLVLASPGTWTQVVYYPYAFPAILAYRLNSNYSYPDFPANSVSILYFLLILVFCYRDFVGNFKG